jgi:hypothetical protein
MENLEIKAGKWILIACLSLAVGLKVFENASDICEKVSFREGFECAAFSGIPYIIGAYYAGMQAIRSLIK